MLFLGYTQYLVWKPRGVILFGQDMQSFSSLSEALVTCWRLLLGDFDIGENGTPGFVWEVPLDCQKQPTGIKQM